MAAYHFMLENAGYSHAPNEPKIVGRRRCAKMLAKAEREALQAGIAFHWEIDRDCDSSDFSDEDPWQLWSCVAYNSDGLCVASLCGIDFGRDGSPWGNSYRRVVEAELALEAQS